MKVGIRPGVNMLAVLRHLKYSPWFALAEYVDNSVQSFISHKSDLPSGSTLYLTIEIDRDDGTITIQDNAAGIYEHEIARAFRPAEPPPDARGLCQFGMGMKSASCWFSPMWEVRTTAYGEPVERLIRFDIGQIVEDRLNEIDIASRTADPEQHFTIITLRDVYQLPQGRTLSKIRDHLSDIYRCFLRDGTLVLSVAGEELTAPEPECLVAPVFDTHNEPQGEPVTWNKSIAFELDNGRIVCGTAGLLAKGDTKRAGLCLLRRNRAIVGTGEDKFRPHEIFGSGNSYESQRVWGEIHMDDFDVTHTKDGFQWGTSEEEFLTKLKSSLDEDDLPLLRQARYYRSGRPTKSSSPTAINLSVSNVISTLTKHGGDDIDRVSQLEPDDSDPPESLASTVTPAIDERTFNIRTSSGCWTVQIELVDDDRSAHWLEIACDHNTAHSNRCVSLRVFLSNPFMRRIVRLEDENSLEPVLRIAAAIGLSEILARFSSLRYGPGEIRRNVNELLGSSLSQP